MNKFFSLIGRLLLAQIYLVSIIIQLMLIFKNPDGYSAYQDFLAQHGLGTIFAPIMILVQVACYSWASKPVARRLPWPFIPYLSRSYSSSMNLSSLCSTWRLRVA